MNELKNIAETKIEKAIEQYGVLKTVGEKQEFISRVLTAMTAASPPEMVWKTCTDRGVFVSDCKRFSLYLNCVPIFIGSKNYYGYLLTIYDQMDEYEPLLEQSYPKGFTSCKNKCGAISKLFNIVNRFALMAGPASQE